MEDPKKEGRTYVLENVLCKVCLAACKVEIIKSVVTKHDE
jgi:hypothetical protein